ncbi:MAG TPA: hypothetical protein VK849_11065 [Longimicrobiales bacterium]|nr:hypothetical protein [Longimicrobiales bacterium]
MNDDALQRPRDAYAGLAARHGAAAAAADRRSVRLSNLRAVTFVAAFGGWVAWDVLEGAAAAVALALAGVLVAVFGVLVVLHRRAAVEERWERALAGVFREGALRLDRDWEGLDAALPAAERREDPPSTDHPYARDLDVTGRASLLRLLGPVTSERGRRVLRGWLLAPAPPAEARRRQGAVRELAPAVELRAAITARGRLEGPDALDGIEAFLAWAEEDSWILGRRVLRAASWALPALLIAAVLADFLAGAPPLWILPAIAQLDVFRRVMPRAQESFGRAEIGGGPLRSIVPQLVLLEGRTWADPLLASIEARLGREEHAARRHLERLSALLDTAESRRNMVYASLSPLLLLDVHLGVRLDRWRAAHGRAVRDWLEALGEWEALSALAALAHDHPDWCDPVFTDRAEPTLSATSLGHPLLPDDACVRNDVRVGPPGTFLLVTGSNMSGKSTLLRALGANVVLASAGAPACASALELPALRVHTSARIDDSLVAGISLFMAELLRIRQVVDAAGAPDPHGRPVLYLLDEVLHGTNTAERRVAARGVIRHLLSSGAIGAVSTHDLTLAEADDLDRAAVKVHFREQVGPDGHGGTRLTFDHRLRAGIATTRNALKLLEAVGLGGLDLHEEEA